MSTPNRLELDHALDAAIQDLARSAQRGRLAAVLEAAGIVAVLHPPDAQSRGSYSWAPDAAWYRQLAVRLQEAGAE